MKHILLITTSFPQLQDGSEAAGAFVADFAATLSERAKVTVLAPALKSSQKSISDNLYICYFKVPVLPLSMLILRRPTHWLAIVRTLRSGTAAVLDIAAKQVIDHTLALWALPSGYWAQQMKGTPYSTWALGSDIWSLSKIPLVKQLLQSTLRKSHSNFADGYRLAEQVEALSSRHCRFLPSTRAIKLSSSKELSTKPPYKLAFLGRWHPNKGIDMLLESLCILDDDDWSNIKEVRIAGGGVLAAQVHVAVEKLKSLSHPVSLQGYLNRDQATELLTWADYVLIPSRIESIPVIFSDAMKCLCPVIAMPVGDLSRLLLTYNVGELADKVSSFSFANALRNALQKPPSSYVNNLRNASNDFSLESSANILLDNIFSEHIT